MPINTSTRLQQVKTHLLNYISQNKLKRNDQLPSEASIAKTLGVSRNTLREAYISLENEGIIVRRHGVGTFVANSPIIRDSLNDFAPFAQIIKEGGYTPSFSTISVDHISPTIDVYKTLNVSPADQIRCIKRVVLADEKPVIYIEDYLSPLVQAEVPDWSQFDGKMVDFLASALDTRLHQIQSNIRATPLSAEISQYLEEEANTPVLSVRSTIYTVDNQAVSYSKICFESDIVELNIVRTIRTQ